MNPKDAIDELRKSLKELVNKRLKCNGSLECTDGRYIRAYNALISTERIEWDLNSKAD